MVSTTSVALLMFFGARVAGAQTYVNSLWNGGNGKWSTASQWSTDAVPGNGGGIYDHVYIIGTGSDTVTFDAYPTTLESLAVGIGETLQADLPNGLSYFLTIGDPTSPDPHTGEFINSGTINWGNGGIFTIGTSTGTNAFGADVENHGTLTIDDATLQVNGNFGTNTGTLTIGNSSEGTVTGTLTSSGTLNVTGDSALFAKGVNTSGTLSVDSGSILNTTLFAMSAGTANIAGTLTTSTFAQTGGTITVQAGATVSAQAWDIYGGTANVQGQVMTQTPPSGTLSVGGNLNLQDGTTASIDGNLTVTGSVVTGNGVNDTGGNLLSVSQLTLNNGTLSLDATGDSLTSGSLVNSTSGTLVVSSGTSLTTTGSLVNSGTFTISGCPLGGCNSTTPQVLVNGTFTNSGTLDIPPSEDEVLRGGITFETVQSAFNSGNIGVGIIDALLLFGPTEVPEPDFNNLSGGKFTGTGSGNTIEVGNGSWNNEAGSTLTLGGSNNTVIANGSFVNAGTVTLSGAGDEIVTPTFTNSGSVAIGAGTTVNVQPLNLGNVGNIPATSYTQTAGSTDVNGTLMAPAVNVAAGTVSGTGLIAGTPSTPGGAPNPTAMTVTGGTVIPGEPGVPGTLTIDGSYTQGADASLLIDINGTGPGNFSVLDVLGAASLDGNVSFDFGSGFTPMAGDSFMFLSASANELTGMFSTEAFDGCRYCTLAYNDAAGTVTLDVGAPPAAAPEPGTWLLLGTGLIGMAALGERRRRRAPGA